MRVGAAAKFGNRTSRIFFLQGEQGFTSSLGVHSTLRGKHYSRSERAPRTRCSTRRVSLPFMVVYGTPWYSVCMLARRSPFAQPQNEPGYELG